MLLLIEILMCLFVGFTVVMIFMGLSIARRLGLPPIAGWTLGVDLRCWPRCWASLLAFLMVVKGLEGWERVYGGLAFWPGGRRELALFLILSGLLTLFTRSNTPGNTPESKSNTTVV